jgi:hypothetical protein
MDRTDKVKLAINGYDVIGKRIADAVACTSPSPPEGRAYDH